jgi:hypothetical protein
MGRKKKPIPDDPKEYARFKETAERIQDENAEEKFNEAMERILPKRQGDSGRSGKAK